MLEQATRTVCFARLQESAPSFPAAEGSAGPLQACLCAVHSEYGRRSRAQPI